ncbi:MAG: LSM domain-containing protein, partial [Promethearchaeota archaeon]
MKFEKPTDALTQSIGRRIKIVLKDFTDISGIFRSFDSHLTVRLDLVEEKGSESSDQIVKKKTNLIRGNSIL